MEISGSVFRFGGLVLTHAALIASEQSEGGLICPFAVIAKDENRQSIDFEADTQAEAIERGKASLDQYRDHVDFWSFAREGLYSVEGSSASKVDVLLVSAWARGMDESIVLMQKFRPNFPGPFELLGDVEVFIEGSAQKGEFIPLLRDLVAEGIKQHPKGERWATWRAAAS